jgi:hypothetical protein
MTITTTFVTVLRRFKYLAEKVMYSNHYNINEEQRKWSFGSKTEIPAFEFKLTANKSYDSTGVGTVGDRLGAGVKVDRG